MAEQYATRRRPEVLGALCLIVTLAIGFCACGQATPVAPTATSTLAPTPSPTPPPATSVTLSGRITETPPTTWTEVAGAVFTISEGVNAGKSVVADSFGYYQLAGLTPGSMTVSVT